MEKLKKVFKSIVKQHNASLLDPNVKDISVLGKGHFAVVFDYDKAVFKLTREGKYENILKSANAINYLKEQGVNCPEHYLVEKYQLKMRADSFMARLHSMVEDSKYSESKEEFYNKLSNMKYYFPKDEQESLVGMFQEKIKGFDYLHSLNKYDFLDFILKVSEEQLYKFIIDASKLLENNIVIDNLSRSNYLYNKEGGFYFIDLDGNNYGTKCPFQCTIGNMLDNLNIYITGFDYDESKQIQKGYDSVFKLYSVTKKAYFGNLNNDIIRATGVKFMKTYFSNTLTYMRDRQKFLPVECAKEYSQKLEEFAEDIYSNQKKQEYNTYFPQV